MEGYHLRLVKEIPRAFKNSDFICERLFGVLRSLMLQKILGNQKDGWGLCTPLKMKCATTLRQRIEIQIISSDQSSWIDSGTLVQTRSLTMKNQSKLQNSMTWS